MLTKRKKIIGNTIILIISSLIIKALGLLNRIFLTRSLGNTGISLYALIMPTIMLFISLSSLSLNTAMIKVSSKYKTKKVIVSGISIAIITSSITSILLLLSLKTISITLLKQIDTYYPILCSIPLLYFTSISSVIRGYFTGIEKMQITSFANIIEQLSRILFTILLFLIFKNQSTLFYVVISILVMSIGELSSLLFTIINLKKIKHKNIEINKIKIKKELLDIAVPSTVSSIISNITFFLEPIIFTFVLTKQNFLPEDILYKYSEVTAYAIPMITLFSFVSGSISMAVMPKLSVSCDNAISSFLSTIITLTIIPSLFISLILHNYSDELCLLLFKTKIGSNLVKKYIYFFIVFYFISPFSTVLLSTGKSKLLFVYSTIVHVIKILSLFVLPLFTNDSLILSYLLSHVLLFVLLFSFLIKKYHFKIQFNNLFLIILIFVITVLSKIVIDSFITSFFIKIILLTIIYLLLCTIFIFKNRNNI